DDLEPAHEAAMPARLAIDLVAAHGARVVAELAPRSMPVEAHLAHYLGPLREAHPCPLIVEIGRRDRNRAWSMGKDVLLGPAGKVEAGAHRQEAEAGGGQPV